MLVFDHGSNRLECESRGLRLLGQLRSMALLPKNGEPGGLPESCLAQFGVSQLTGPVTFVLSRQGLCSWLSFFLIRGRSRPGVRGRGHCTLSCIDMPVLYINGISISSYRKAGRLDGRGGLQSFMPLRHFLHLDAEWTPPDHPGRRAAGEGLFASKRPKLPAGSRTAVLLSRGAVPT